MLYRIITENKNYPDIVRILGNHFPNGFTLLPANGYWMGNPEPSLIAEISTSNRMAVMSAAEDIRANNNQQTVLVQSLPVESFFVSAMPVTASNGLEVYQ